MSLPQAPKLTSDSKSPGVGIISDSDSSWFERSVRQNRLLVLGMLAFLALATLVVYYVPPLARADVYTDDMRQHISWYYGARNPRLFRNDIMESYFTGMCPLGYKAMFRLASAYVDPQTLGEILSLVLGSAGVILAYKVGQAASSDSVLGGITAALLLLFGNALGLHLFIKVFQGGLQRAFALPIFLLGTWALLGQNRLILAVALVSGALFFPPVCVSLMVFSALLAAANLLKGRFSRQLIKDTLILAGAWALSAALLLLSKALSAGTGHWTVYTLKEALTMPEYYAGGTWDMLIDKPILYHNWSEYFTKAITVPHPLLLASVTLIFLWRSRIHRTSVILLALSSLVTWGIAYVVFFNLYEPSRYILYPLMTFWLIVLPGAVVGLILALEAKLKPSLERLPKVALWTKAGLVAAFVVAVGGGSSYLTFLRIRLGEGGMTGTAPPEVYKFLRSLPEDVKIAAHPIDADDIPMRSQRSVLAFRKAIFPYHHELYEEMKARVAATWEALYATNYQSILYLRQHYGADVLVVNNTWFKEEPIKAKPYDAIVQSCRSKLGDATPLVLQMPQEAVLFRSGPFTVLDLAALERIEGSSSAVPEVAAQSSRMNPENPEQFKSAGFTGSGRTPQPASSGKPSE